ncbi:DUF3006 domain-containing protein [Methanoregula sp.]|uniref:DUF3006 domain-containing protein n=1 Tax=Methanoregula sp. TaxID=2052170 RepID=UPI00236AE64C|nr:DUF3006 domain-containing protein [Methanoregula sp.]MDD1687604.1 DUF3006 domain-containing protein [Methanoregula sp.]
MKATIDRIEEGIAVLILRTDEPLRFHLPVSLLPPECREGDIVTIAVERDTKATAEARDRVAGLIHDLQKKGGT